MNQGSHPAGKPSRRAKSPTAVISLALVLVLGIGATAAYLVAGSGPVENEFLPAKSDVTIVEKFDGHEKKDITFESDTDIPVFVRATLAVYWTDSDGNVVSQPEGCSYTGGETLEGWTKIGEVYYYGKALEPKGGEGDETTVMLKPITATIPEGSGYELNVEVLCEAIQAEPASAVQEAWGVSIAGGSVTAVPADAD